MGIKGRDVGKGRNLPEYPVSRLVSTLLWCQRAVAGISRAVKEDGRLEERLEPSLGRLAVVVVARQIHHVGRVRSSQVKSK